MGSASTRGRSATRSRPSTAQSKRNGVMMQPPWQETDSWGGTLFSYGPGEVRASGIRGAVQEQQQRRPPSPPPPPHLTGADLYMQAANATLQQQQQQQHPRRPRLVRPSSPFSVERNPRAPPREAVFGEFRFGAPACDVAGAVHAGAAARQPTPPNPQQKPSGVAVRPGSGSLRPSSGRARAPPTSGGGGGGSGGGGDGGGGGRPGSAASTSMGPLKDSAKRFTTLFQRPNVARKMPLSAHEQLQFFFTGVHTTRRRPPSPEPEDEAAAVLNGAKRRLEALITARQATVESLRQLLPLPADEKDAARLAKEILGSPAELDARRAHFLELLGELRTRGAAIVTATGHWRTCLRRAQHHYISLPDHEIPFWFGNASFPAHLVADLDFLPAPVATDPLLLSWYGKQLPWMFANLPKVAGLPLAHVCMTLAADAADARGSVVIGGLSPTADAATRERETTMLERAQRTILMEAHKLALVCTPSQLQKGASRKVRGGEWTPERWQWSALQSLLYGEPTYYLRLLRGLPSCHAGLQMLEAVRVVLIKVVEVVQVDIEIHIQAKLLEVVEVVKQA